MYSEYVGISQELATLIETHRTNPSETKCDILLRILPRAAIVSPGVV